MSEQTTPKQPTEPLVTLAGPFDHRDVEDGATGLRFVGGKAVGVPLSVAREIADRRRGYYIEPYGRE
jgi:hypothetical protein